MYDWNWTINLDLDGDLEGDLDNDLDYDLNLDLDLPSGSPILFRGVSMVIICTICSGTVWVIGVTMKPIQNKQADQIAAHILDNHCIFPQHCIN